jgi:hypothetical protein
MKKWITATIIFALLFICMVRYAFLHEISIEPYNMAIHQKKKELGIPAVYLISYADGPEVFLRNQNALASSAINKGIDFIMNYRRDHLDPKFVKKNKQILDQKKGAGYWLWKPYLILKTLKEIPEGAVLIYSDTGLTLTKDIGEFLDLLIKDKGELLLTSYSKHSIKQITKRETFIRMGCDHEEAFKAPRLIGGFMVMKNTGRVRNFIQRWLKNCEDQNLLIEGSSSKPEYPEFSTHQHDQSILSLLYYKERNKQGINLYHFYEDQGRLLHYHHRHPMWKKRPYRILRGFKGKNIGDNSIEIGTATLLSILNAVPTFINMHFARKEK